jgi:hypothetical protein
MNIRKHKVYITDLETVLGVLPCGLKIYAPVAWDQNIC